MSNKSLGALFFLRICLTSDSFMKQRVVIAVDSFKGSLAAHEVAKALSEGIRSATPLYQITELPLADGGEGSAEIITRARGGQWVAVDVSNPLGVPITAHYGLLSADTAVLDVASAAGLTLLQAEERNPLLTSSRGVGQMIRSVLDAGCRNVIIGVGGSATNDCATGLLSALGYRFVDSNGGEVEPCGASLHRIATIDSSDADHRLRHTRFTLAVDVQSPFCGAQGAAHIFAPQKGATPQMVAMLDEGMAHLAEVVRAHCGVDITNIEGAGAAGGIGGALYALLGAKLCSGADTIMDCVGFDNTLSNCDLVITGEGRIDHQTLRGKLPVRVLERAGVREIPVVAVGGGVDMCAELAESGFAEIVAATPNYMPLSEAIRPEVARQNLIRTGAEIAKKWLREP